jgi:hypothetical protein
MKCGEQEYVCEVWQSAYGHRATKRTQLFYVGPPPKELCWDRKKGSHKVGWHKGGAPTMGKKEANLTPTAFADALIALLES